MPEGPSIVILKELALEFKGKRVRTVEGNTKLDKERLVGQKLTAIHSYGKHFLLAFRGFALRVHFLMFGTYRINERKPDKPIRLGLTFEDGTELNLYSCAIQYVEGKLDDTYDWGVDVMSDAWDEKVARKRLRAHPDMAVCDALLDQDLFAGVGNIIKNEVLFRIRVHPMSLVGALPAAKLRELVYEARNYSFQFLEWKREYTLKQHWLAHTKRTCPRCQIPLLKHYMGKTARRTFYCDRCQKRYPANLAYTLPAVTPKPRKRTP
ncbi:MAG TPA: DNA-formamidopyrimidine glycosylase family protein [Burkholderiaceae bacterium]